MILSIDDTRNLKCDVTARNYKSGLQLLNCCSWEILYIDHDLGIETISCNKRLK